MEKEIWKAIEGFEGLYEISNQGVVRSSGREIVYADGRVYKYKQQVRKLTLNKGYLYVTLRKNGQTYSRKVHRLVAQAFIPNPLKKTCIDHVNTNKLDNRADNLRWVTHSENMMNDITRRNMSNRLKEWLADKIVKVKKEKGYIKKVFQFNKDGELIKEFDSMAEASKITGICLSSISQNCNGSTSYSHAGGYLWSFNEIVAPYVNPQMKRYKKIDLLSTNGEYIRTFTNVIEASEIMKVKKKGIHKCCRGDAKTYMGYIWKYNEKTERYEQKNREKESREGIQDSIEDNKIET